MLRIAWINRHQANNDRIRKLPSERRNPVLLLAQHCAGSRSAGGKLTTVRKFAARLGRRNKTGKFKRLWIFEIVKV